MSRTFRPTDRAPRVRRQRLLRNPVVAGSSRRLIEELVQQKMEQDPWYVDNSRAAFANVNTTETARRNVIARLYIIAKHRAEKQLGVRH